MKISIRILFIMTMCAMLMTTTFLSGATAFLSGATATYSGGTSYITADYYAKRPTAHWKLDEESGSTVNDDEGSHNGNKYGAAIKKDGI